MERTKKSSLPKLQILVDRSIPVPRPDSGAVIVLAGIGLRRRKGCDWRLVATVSREQMRTVCREPSARDWAASIQRASDTAYKARACLRIDPDDEKRIARLDAARADLREKRSRLDWLREALDEGFGVAYVDADDPHLKFVYLTSDKRT